MIAKVCTHCKSEEHEDCYNRIVISKYTHFKRMLVEKCLVSEDTPSLSYVDDVEKIKGRHVFGTLPLYIACNAHMVTEIPIHLPHHLYKLDQTCLLYTSPSPRDRQKSRMPSSA